MTVSKFRLVWKISDLSNKDLHKKYATYFSLFHKVLCIRGMLSFIFQNINFVGNGGIGVGDGVMWELTKHCLRHLKVLRSAFASESISMSNGGVLYIVSPFCDVRSKFLRIRIKKLIYCNHRAFIIKSRLKDWIQIFNKYCTSDSINSWLTNSFSPLFLNELFILQNTW